MQAKEEYCGHYITRSSWNETSGHQGKGTPFNLKLTKKHKVPYYIDISTYVAPLISDITFFKNTQRYTFKTEMIS